MKWPKEQIERKEQRERALSCTWREVEEVERGGGVGGEE